MSLLHKAVLKGVAALDTVPAEARRRCPCPDYPEGREREAGNLAADHIARAVGLRGLEESTRDLALAEVEGLNMREGPGGWRHTWPPVMDCRILAFKDWREEQGPGSTRRRPHYLTDPEHLDLCAALGGGACEDGFQHRTVRHHLVGPVDVTRPDLYAPLPEGRWTEISATGIVVERPILVPPDVMPGYPNPTAPSRFNLAFRQVDEVQMAAARMASALEAYFPRAFEVVLDLDWVRPTAHLTGDPLDPAEVSEVGTVFSVFFAVFPAGAFKISKRKA